MKVPLISLEEHFFASKATEKTVNAWSEQFKHVPGLREKIHDLEDIRLRDMDAGNIALQIISHGPIPGGPGVQESIAANDQLAAAIAKNKTRFAGFATLPMSSASEASAELRRCVRQLNFVGALIDCQVDGKFYDGPEYLPFWTEAQDLNVPIYIHPTWASDPARYEGNFSQAAAKSMAASGWSWHSETAMHILRLFASGLFDRLPKLKIIIGHMGEMIPFMLERICQLSVRWSQLERVFNTVWRENVWITTSGVWSLAPLATILMNTPIDHIMYSVDYPLAKNEDGLKWMQDLEKSNMVTAEQFEMIAFGNAEKLLGVKLSRA